MEEYDPQKELSDWIKILEDAYLRKQRVATVIFIDQDGSVESVSADFVDDVPDFLQSASEALRDNELEIFPAPSTNPDVGH
ncbi:MAG TPA: hypothetical protein VIS07_10500 [Candidatus Binatia bacterium]